MPSDDKRPGRALGFGLPEPDAEPDGAISKDRLQSIEAKVDELLRKRGRPRDAHADALSEVSEAAVPVLKKAIEHVLEDVPLDVLVAVNMPAIMDQVVQEFGRLLIVAMKAGGTWHYEKQRKVLGDPKRAMRSGNRRRLKTIDPSD